MAVISVIDQYSSSTPLVDCDGIILLYLWCLGRPICVVLANGFRVEMTCASLEHLC